MPTRELLVLHLAGAFETPAVYGGSMAHPLTLTSRLPRKRDGLVVCRPRSTAHCLLNDLGDRPGQVLALLRACGLRFRDGARWQLPAKI